MKSRLVEFGKRVREARLGAGLSQPELARRIGKSKQLVSAWENGRTEMMTMTLADLAASADADVNWLLRGGDNPNETGVKRPPPRGSVVPLLTATDAIKLARGKFSLEEAPTRIYTCVKAGARAFALDVGDNSMRPDLVAGDMVVCDPDHHVAPGGIVAAVVRQADSALPEPALVLRCVHFKSATIGEAPFDLVPLAPAWPVLSIRKRSHAVVLGPVITICRAVA